MVEPELKRRRKNFTAEEREKIRQSLEKDMKPREIAKELGRTKSIYNFIYKQKLRTRLKESLPKLGEQIKTKETKLKALDEQIKANKDELTRIEEQRRTVEYRLTKGLEESKRFVYVYRDEIVAQWITVILSALGFSF